MPTQSSYKYSLVRRIVNTKVGGRLSAITTAGDTGTDTNIERDLINSAVRVALSDIDFRGSLREVVLAPNLMNNQFDYAIPSDVKADKIVDFAPQVTDCRGFFEEFNLVSPEEFDRRKEFETGLYTIKNDDLTRTLRISAIVDDKTSAISNLDNTNAGGDTWDAFASGTTGITTDADDFVEGTGSIRFQADSVDSAVGVENSGLDVSDLSDFMAQGSVFVDAKTTFPANADQIVLRLGSDSDNFHQVSDSNQNDCTPFEVGWNKIRWDLRNRTTTGTPVDTAIDYVALFWSRDTTDTTTLESNDTDLHFDNLVVKRGSFYNLSYYSRFPWQSDTSTSFPPIENSVNDSDALMVQNDELEVIMAKASELASVYLRNPTDRDYYRVEYDRLKTSYLMANPSQANPMTKTYYNFGSFQDTSIVRDS